MRARSAKSERYPGPAKVPSWAPIGAALIATGQIMVSSEQTARRKYVAPPSEILAFLLVARCCFAVLSGVFRIILMD